MATYINRQEEDEREVEDDGIYEIATVSFNPRRLIVLAPFQIIPVALDSCHRDLCSRAISFYITCL